MPDLTRDDGVKIYWEETGAGDPLLLIMGLGATLEWWQRLIPVLSPHYRTIVYDNRGVGRSDVPPGPYPIPVMAADAVAVLDAAGVESAHVFGASMGGMIAQELALNYPSRVRSLILGCTACGGKEVVPASKEVGAALSARKNMTREQAMWLMAPYVFDAGTPRERIAEDIAVRLQAKVTNDGYFAQLDGIRTWRGSHARLSGLTDGIRIDLPKGPLTFSVSWGGAEFGRGRTLEEAMRMADMKMYERRERRRTA